MVPVKSNLVKRRTSFQACKECSNEIPTAAASFESFYDFSFPKVLYNKLLDPCTYELNAQ